MNLNFWKDALERAFMTAVQAVVALEGTGALHLTHLDWTQIGSIVAGAAWASFTKSLIAAQITGTASLVKPNSAANAEHDAEVLAQVLAKKLSK